MASHLRRLALVAAFAAAASPAFAEQPAPRSMTMSGQGIVRAAPDEANFSAGVATQGATAAEALAANSRAMNAVFATLKKLGIPDKDIQTSNFSLSPRYQICRPDVNCPQRIIGYEVSNDVDVTVESLAKTGAVLDALVSSGSNQIGGIGFSIHDTKPLLAQARAEAVQDAVDRAKTYAKAAGVTLGPILSIQEGQSEGPRPMFAMMAKAVAAPPPIAGGEQSVTANVTITWALK
ncbi:MAG: SIMPL domain-containing protein [Alphaproteobacteria bacterium]|nr:SIMPL domain-containing protein [Alphaproteobacteria bacterium]MDE2109854.1 SIMPL domain-containing protein [Alphaproteobacteria bacterium]MDE2493538.1 SIMPL domain-containing protein [Alphaproteobacteria bacterium]